MPILGLLLLAGLFKLAAVPAVALAEPPEALEITGDGVVHPFVLTFDELEAMEHYEHVYSTINTWPTKRWYTARGVELRKLINLAGIKEEATLVRFVSSDGYDVTLTVQELLEDKRYYFPGLKDNHPSDGSIPGSPEDAREVEPILALVSAEGSDRPGDMNDRDALLLVLGQRAVTEQTNNLFLKYVNRIEVLTTTPEKWDRPRANIPSGTVVPAGTGIELSNKHNNEDKIYYTTDGSTPTVNSPMFNWSASRWWEQRDDLKGVNKPIEVEKDTVIKMITIGPGKMDSEVVTFTFTADLTGKAVDPTKVPGGPPTEVTLDRSVIDRPIGSTFQLAAHVAPFNAVNREVTWSSSDTGVAAVDNRGLVTVVGPGTAAITVTTVEGNLTATCVVNGPAAGENSGDAVPAATNAQEPQPPEVSDGPPPENEPPEPPETPEAVAPAADAVTSERVPEAPAEPPVPEDRAQYLAQKEELAAGSATGNVMQQTEQEAWQVFAISADTVPLPLQEAQDRTAVVTFWLLFISGAGKRYAEYKRER
jgi:hypothetical protein